MFGEFFVFFIVSCLLCCLQFGSPSFIESLFIPANYIDLLHPPFLDACAHYATHYDLLYLWFGSPSLVEFFLIPANYIDLLLPPFLDACSWLCSLCCPLWPALVSFFLISVFSCYICALCVQCYMLHASSYIFFFILF